MMAPTHSRPRQTEATTTRSPHSVWPPVADLVSTRLGQRCPALRPSVETIAVTDIEGSTSMVEALGDEPFAQVMFTHDGIIRSVAEYHHGREISHTGDGFMLTFSTATEAARCMVGIQQALEGFNAGRPDPLSVRAGIHTGVVLTDSRKRSHVGLAIHIAHRVSTEAAGGEVLLSEAAIETLDLRCFKVGSPRLVALKGLMGKYRLTPLLHEVLPDKSCRLPEPTDATRMGEM